MFAHNQQIVFPESATLTYGSSRHQRLQILVLYISYTCYYTWRRIIEGICLPVYINEIVIEYKFDNHKIIGENIKVIVIIIVIDENNYKCYYNWPFYKQIIIIVIYSFRKS